MRRYVSGARVLAAATVLACSSAAAAPAAQTGAQQVPHLWEQVPDDVYLQEVGEKVLTSAPLTAVALHSNIAYVVTEGKVKALSGDVLESSPGSPAGVTRLRSISGTLWAITGSGLFRMTGSGWNKAGEQAFVDVCLHLGKVYAATSDDLFAWEGDHFVNIRPEKGYLSTDTTVMMEDFSQVLMDPVRIGPIQRIASYSGTLYLLRPGGLALIEGQTFVPDPVDWGRLPSPVTRDMVALGSRLYIATDRGLGVLRGMAITALRGTDGLPYEDITCLAPEDGTDVWVGTSRGLVRKTSEEYHFFGARHWLPGDYVHDVAAGPNVVYAATDGGLAIIRYEPYTLRKKAAWFQREMDEWGFKRLGFIHKLYWAGDKDGWLREISDNDGGNTASYLAAMSFRFAVTGDEQARDEALEAFRAIVWLDDITPKPGFIARAIWSVKGDKGERSTSGSGGLPAKWYPTANGLWFWKGDTSSDEVNAHIFGASLFHDLAAKGRDKERAKQHIANIATHILQNGWVLRDMDGKPTRWGRWDPDYLLKPYGFEARGLNGMEAQTYMLTAFALTQDPKFQRGLQQLLDWRYHTYTVRQRITIPPEQIAPWDDELAFFCYTPLLRYTTDPALRSIYLRSLERTWEILRMQQVPFYNFSYGGLTGNDCEAPEAVQHLREWSLDLVNHDYHNSHRSDLATARGYTPYSGGARAFSPRELEAKWGARVSIQPDGGEHSHGVTPPTGWLLDYWMGRYYGFIKAPTTENPEATTLAPRDTKRHSALPYVGPPRPMGDWEK